MKRAAVYAVTICLALGFFCNMNPANASDLSSTIDYAVSDWVLDEDNGYIYAVSNADCVLMFIRTDTLQVTKTIPLGTNPTDLDLYENKLYIPLEKTKQIVEVDTSTQSVCNTYTTANYPIRTDILGDSLFFTSTDNISIYEQRCTLSVYHLASGTEQTLAGSYYCPDIAVDRTKDVLFIGESSLTACLIKAISASDYSRFEQQCIHLFYRQLFS